ncbi:GNAT family N-acetyltransferase [Parvibaculaceae bacterium PLY_AMNH_Bact1]|nr:GNAT family N-acetyltransferase [Parvibaculaceae bacterium PLY_AMNH_Bact1]
MIREYKTEDTDALVSVWKAATSVAHPFLKQAFMAQETENLRNLYLPNAETWVVEDNDAPVGFIALIGDEIGGLFLDPACHGKGLGKAMVDHAIGLKGPLWLEVFEKNAVGRRFYDRYGFVETDRSMHEASGEIAIKLTFTPV